MYYIVYGLLYSFSLLPFFILYGISDVIAFTLFTLLGYRKKVVMAKGFKFAEVNVYYGKQGFTVYKTPKRGSDEQLADLVKELIERVIYADYN